ncbi:winged helix DNA-binding domain-containing protein [Microbacterium sp. ZW T5_56]|uniref:winged helix DNA-binding domain-containing protein n=1 Tax=Microbacterium sp. ZW T5_56 TaxID=3378081 RepID=UPI003853CBB8
MGTPRTVADANDADNADTDNAADNADNADADNAADNADNAADNAANAADDAGLDALRAARLSSHLLAEPAESSLAAAERLAAIQAQEFWGGRFALSVRTTGAPTARQLDALFDSGDLIRTWPMRGTLHVISALDAAWMVPITAERIHRSAAARHRQLGLAADDFARAERILRRVLGSGGLRRADVFAALEADGVATTGQRGSHILLSLALRGVVVWGATVPRPDQPATEQLLTLTEHLPPQRPTPSDPAAELFRRYLVGHAPASIADFAWWAGTTITAARAAAAAVRDDDAPVTDTALLALRGDRAVLWEPATRTSPADTGDRLLGSFEEYYISYADRSVTADAGIRAEIGPGKNGMVKPVVLRGGRVVATWSRGAADELAPQLTETWRNHIA